MAGAVPLPGGTSAEEAAGRLAPVVHLLEWLARRSAGWLEHELRLDRKLALAEHAADDARTAAALRRRVSALDRSHPGAPAGGTAEMLALLTACSAPSEHFEVAYGQVKPLVGACAAAYLEAADPLVELPTVSLLVTIAADQRRHCADLGATGEPPAGHSPEGLSVEPGGSAPFEPVPKGQRPVRDPYVERVPERPPLDDLVDALNALLNASVAAGERAGRGHHDTGSIESAQRAAVHLRHAAVVDRMLVAAGSRWGERPVGPPHDDPFVVAEVVAVQHPVTERALGHLLSERP